jgi:hypothetical protein
MDLNGQGIIVGDLPATDRVPLCGCATPPHPLRFITPSSQCRIHYHGQCANVLLRLLDERPEEALLPKPASGGYLTHLRGLCQRPQPAHPLHVL